MPIASVYPMHIHAEDNAMFLTQHAAKLVCYVLTMLMRCKKQKPP